MSSNPETSSKKDEMKQQDSTKQKNNNSQNKKQNKKKSKKPLIDLEPVRGTRDFLPENMRKQRWLFDNFRQVAHLFGFEEYDAPILESEELYRVKAGAAGEDLLQQMYNFKDKSDRPVTMRPEMTPSLARLVLKHRRELVLPCRWFSIPQCWRYEAITRGRRREHYQWNMDILGAENMTAEAELLCVLVTFFKRVGLTSDDIVIKFSSRQLIQGILESQGIPEETFAPTCVILDKLDKQSEEEVTQQLLDAGVEEEAAKSLVQTMKLDSLENFDTMLGSDHPSLAPLKELMSYCEAYDIQDWITFDPSVVRGLAYYTGVVFEAFERPRKGGMMRAVCGGGRYDRLINTFAPRAESMPAIGFGFGDIVILEVLADRNVLPDFSKQIDAIVIPFGESERSTAMKVAAKLRSKEQSVDIVLKKKQRLDKSFRYADRSGAQLAYLVAPEEREKGMVKVKKLNTGKDDPDAEYTISLDEL
eukprot:gb/GECH01009298.1/.p1 GENE.gb/GECH01009298.1/~~gb/GECH01009298.1/.p1  ORF type:complete len:475 (+),score=146.27 gb/GECH01009298.1/:1-1425(+)